MTINRLYNYTSRNIIATVADVPCDSRRHSLIMNRVTDALNIRAHPSVRCLTGVRRDLQKYRRHYYVLFIAVPCFVDGLWVSVHVACHKYWKNFSFSCGFTEEVISSVPPDAESETLLLLSSNVFRIYCLLTILPYDPIQSELLTTSLNKQTGKQTNDIITPRNHGVFSEYSWEWRHRAHLMIQ